MTKGNKSRGKGCSGKIPKRICRREKTYPCFSLLFFAEVTKEMSYRTRDKGTFSDREKLYGNCRISA